jgi:hypothetical protein
MVISDEWEAEIFERAHGQSGTWQKAEQANHLKDVSAA